MSGDGYRIERDSMGEVKVPAYTVRQQVFSSSKELRDHLQRADRIRLNFHLIPG